MARFSALRLATCLFSAGATFGNAAEQNPDMTCGNIKDQYKQQACCGQPEKKFALPSPPPPLLTERCNICVVGCAPYSSNPYPKFSKVVEKMASECSLMIHVGDLMAGSDVCNRTIMSGPLDLMKKSGTPLLYTPGDNEVSDCHRPASSGVPADFYKAEDARNFFIDEYFKDTKTDLTGTMAVETQSATCPFNVYVERCGAAVVTLEVPGSQWYLGDESSSKKQQDTVDPIADRKKMYDRSKDCALSWLDTSMQKANSTGKRAVIIAYQAGFWQNTDAFTGNYGKGITSYGFGGTVWNMTTLGYLPYQPLSDKLLALADAYPHIMIYTVDADWHFWHVQSPMMKKNLVNVMVEGSAGALTSYGSLSINYDLEFDPVTVRKVHVMAE